MDLQKLRKALREKSRAQVRAENYILFFASQKCY